MCVGGTVGEESEAVHRYFQWKLSPITQTFVSQEAPSESSGVTVVWHCSLIWLLLIISQMRCSYLTRQHILVWIIYVVRTYIGLKLAFL